MPSPTPLGATAGRPEQKRRRLRRLGSAAGVVIALALPTAIQTLPSPSQLASRVAPNAGDSLFVTWTLASEAHAAVHHPGSLFAANIFYPRRDAIAWSDNLLAAVPVYGLLQTVTGGRKILAYNLVTFLGYLGVGLATYLLALEVLGDRAAALVSATVLSLSMARSVAVGHTQLVGFLFVPLALVALVRFLDLRRWPAAVAFGLAAAATWLVTAYYAILLALVVVPFLVVWLAQRRFRPGPRLWAGLSLAGVVAVIVVSPTLPPYLRLQRGGLFTRPAQAGIRLADFGRVPPSLLYRAITSVGPIARYDRGGLYPGLVLGLLVLTAAGAALVEVARRRSRPGGTARLGRVRRDLAVPLAVSTVPCLVVMGGIRSSDTLSIPFRVLRRIVPGVSSLRDLDRFWIFPLLCLALAAGAGALRLFAAAGRRWTPVVMVAVLLTAWAELLFRPPTVPVDLSAQATAANRLLARLAPGAVLELPEPLGPTFPYVNAARQLRSLIDGNPRVDGYSGNVPPETQVAESLASRESPSSLVGPMRAFGVRYFVLHGTVRACAAGYNPDELGALAGALRATPGVERIDPAGSDLVVELAPAPIDRALPAVGPGPPRPADCG